MEEKDEILTEFLAEANEFLDRLERDLVDVEGGKDPAGVVAETFRAFHTLKGTAGFLGFEELRELAHAGEDLLAGIRDGEVGWTKIVTDTLLQVLDGLRVAVAVAAGMHAGIDAQVHAELVGRLRAMTAGPKAAEPLAAPAPPPPPPPAAAAPSPPAAAPPLAKVAPLYKPAAPAPRRVQAPGGPTPEPVKAPEALAAPAPASAKTPEPTAAPRAAPADAEHGAEASSTLRVPVPVLDRLMNLVGELVLARNQLLCQEGAQGDARLAATSQRIDQLTAGLQEAVMKARMQPIDTVFARLPRVARDAAQLCGKEVRLTTAGRETELDKTLLEAIKDPLAHVVRNAVDHGIERPEVRRAAGKPPEGAVSIRAFHDGGHVTVEVTDDGGGVNLERVRQKAVANGLLSAEEAVRLPERQVIELLFRAGFSTAEAVTAISGRGVGMDVVRTNVERIGGSVELASRPGQGTTVRIRVPLTLVIVPSLIVSRGQARYAVPQANLVELVRIAPEREERMVVDVQGTALLRLRGSILPLVDLGAVLGQGASARSADGARQVVVLSAAGRQFGLLVDDLADTEEIVVKPLGRQLQRLGIFAGATVRGDGRVSLVLDVLGLARRTGVLAEGAERADAAQRAAETAAPPRRPYLILRGKDDGRLAIALGEVTRLEEFAPAQIERVGDDEAVQYRDAILPLVRLSALLPERRRRSRTPERPADGEKLQVMVQEWGGRPLGLLVDAVLDVVEEAAQIDASRARPGVAGCAVLQGRITEVLDTNALLSRRFGRASTEGGAP